MKYSLPASLLAHALVAASGMFAWSVAPRDDFKEIVDIRLEGIDLGEFTDISEIVKPEVKQGEEDKGDPEDDPTDQETPAPDEVKTDNKAVEPDDTEAVPDLDDIKPEPTPTPSPTPTPTPTPTKTPTPTPTPTKKPLVEERKEKTEKKPDLNDLLSDTEDLLKDLTAKPKKETKTKTQRKELEDLSDTGPRDAAGKKTGNQAAVIDVLRAQMKERECYRSVSDLPNWEDLDVTIRFQLDSKGRISKAPVRIAPKSIDSHDRFILVASERAIRAIQLCAPFNLPEDDYDLWRNQNIDLTFDESF